MIRKRFKQHITIKQWDELSIEKKWWFENGQKPKGAVLEVKDKLPNIGQIIEFIETELSPPIAMGISVDFHEIEDIGKKLSYKLWCVSFSLGSEKELAEDELKEYSCCNKKLINALWGVVIFIFNPNDKKQPKTNRDQEDKE